MGSIPELGRFPWRRKRLLTPVSLPQDSTDRGARWATVHGVTESDTTERLTLVFHFFFATFYMWSIPHWFTTICKWICKSTVYTYVHCILYIRTCVYIYTPSPQGDEILYVNEHISYRVWSTFPVRGAKKSFCIWLKFDRTIGCLVFEIF